MNLEYMVMVYKMMSLHKKHLNACLDKMMRDVINKRFKDKRINVLEKLAILTYRNSKVLVAKK